MALTKSYGNISKASELLGITRPTLYDLLSKYGLSAEGYSKKAAP
ncbi:MAG: helix-turn-helix domain-containing protein [Woeseiaceae bacterium]